MRVLTLATEFPPARGYGLGRYIAEHAAALVEAGAEVHVACNNFDTTRDTYEHEGVKVGNAPFPLPVRGHTWVNETIEGSSLLLGRAVQMVRDSGTYSILQAHDWLAASTARCLQETYGLPLVLTMHDTQIGKSLGQLGEEQQYVADVEGWLLERADRVVANSEFMARELGEAYGVAEERIDVVHCGVNPRTFEAAGDPGLFKSLFCSGDERLIGFVGRLTPTKGPQVLLEAVRHVTAVCPGVRFAFAGDGPMRGALEQRSQELGVAGDVRFVGHLAGPVLPTFYRAADVIVVPSLYEPFGMVALEACVCGTPVIVSDTGGLSEIVGHGENGLKVAPNDATALASAVVQLLYDASLAERLAVAGHQNALANFSWHAAARKTLQVYGRVLGHVEVQ